MFQHQTKTAASLLEYVLATSQRAYRYVDVIKRDRKEPGNPSQNAVCRTRESKSEPSADALCSKSPPSSSAPVKLDSPLVPLAHAL